MFSEAIIWTSNAPSRELCLLFPELIFICMHNVVVSTSVFWNQHNAFQLSFFDFVLENSFNSTNIRWQKNYHFKKKHLWVLNPQATDQQSGMTKWASCEWQTQKSSHYPTVMVDWFQLNSSNSSNQVNLIQNRKNANVCVRPKQCQLNLPECSTLGLKVICLYTAI